MFLLSETIANVANIVFDLYVSVVMKFKNDVTCLNVGQIRFCNYDLAKKHSQTYAAHFLSL